MRYEFDEIAFRNEFKSALKDVFADEYETLGTEVQVITNEYQKSTFPCCVVSILNPTSNTRYDDDEGSYHKINFSVNIDIYCKQLNGLTLEDSILKLSQIAINGLLKSYSNLTVTRNNRVPYSTDVFRKTITLRGVYDVKNKIIYSN